MIENIEQAKKHLKEIVDFYKLNDENNYDYSDDVLISIRIVLEEIERLNNIINEIEKELDLNLPFKVIGVRGLKNKIKELKEK